METVDTRQVYESPWLSVREDVVRRADGTTGAYAVVDSADIALVIAIDGDRLHLVEQHRYAVAARRWEFPSGSMAPGDRGPEDAAARELREETGLRASSLVRLGVLDAAPGTMSHRCYVFLATGTLAGEAERDPEEQDMRARWFSRAEFEEDVGSGRIVDAKSVAAYTLLLLHERRLEAQRRGARPSVGT